MPTLRAPVRVIDAKTKEIDWRFDALPNAHLSYFVDVESQEVNYHLLKQVASSVRPRLFAFGHICWFEGLTAPPSHASR